MTGLEIIRAPGTTAEQIADIVSEHCPPVTLEHCDKPVVITTSGGKDSSICLTLAERAGIPYEVLHHHTTVDAPETVYFVRGEFRRLEGMGVKCGISYPVYKGAPISMWTLIP